MRAIVTVIGRDQVGIIAAVCSLLSEKNVNVLDISQTVLQEYFTMIMLVDAAQATVPFARLLEDLAPIWRRTEIWSWRTMCWKPTPSTGSSAPSPARSRSGPWQGAPNAWGSWGTPRAGRWRR